jgi:hypothetical protein
MTAEDLEVKACWFERIIRGLEADAELHEHLAVKIAKRDEYMAAHIRRITTRAHIEMIVDRIRWLARTGEYQQAEQAAVSFENHWNYLKDLHRISALEGRQGNKRGGKKGGQASKESAWAHILAAHLVQRTTNKDEAWELIPETTDPDSLELENYGDELKIYRDGNYVCCNENGTPRRKLAKTTFFKKRYWASGQ